MDDVTQWVTPTGRVATVHFPNENCRPLPPGSAGTYVVGLCRAGMPRKRFTEDASRVTCRRCRELLNGR